MKVRSCAISDVGRKRQKNEDSYLINDKLQLFIVADGMGGHAGGEYASRIAITTIEETLKTKSANSSSEGLVDSIKVAAKKIVEESDRDSSLRGMGTTVIALKFDQKNAYIGHVGDSRAYQLRGGELCQVTEDHSFVNEQVKIGLLTEEEAKNHQFKNIITRSLGVTPEVEVDLITKDLKVGDTFLLCSDGLSNLVELSEMQSMLRDSEPMQAAKDLVDLANKRGGDDNITLLVIEVLEV